MAPGAGREDAIHAADRIIAAVSAPHQIESGKVHVGCSVGVAMFPEHGHDGATLLRHADTALHGAKAAGRNRWRFFTDDLLASAIERQQLEDGLRCGLDEAAFELFYQPKIRMADGLLCGCEALLRWHHPEWGWVSPLRFIHSAEETGLIVPLGRWALREAIRQARQWELAGLPGGTVAVNISALELRQEGFVASVHGLLAEVALTPARLQLELTESTLMRDMAAAAGLLGQLKALGLSIAIDDFGTGYSSLNYLAELPIDLLKVDRSFVHGIDRAAPRKQALLRAVLALGDSLAMPTVAEGVETQDEARFLLDAGCTLGQGYFYSRPMTPEAFGVAFLPGGGR
jgi:predicted signal transduction protein with EAL and GGDEF domain